MGPLKYTREIYLYNIANTTGYIISYELLRICYCFIWGFFEVIFYSKIKI